MFKIDEYSASLTTEKKMLFNIMKLLEMMVMKENKPEPQVEMVVEPVIEPVLEPVIEPIIDTVTCDRCGNTSGKNGKPFTVKTINVHKINCKGG